MLLQTRRCIRFGNGVWTHRCVSITFKRHYSTPDSEPRESHDKASLRQKLKPYLQSLDQRFVTTVKRFHDVTGYSEIERLKQKILDTESEVGGLRETVRVRRDAFNNAVANRTASQREMNELLLRKQAWTPEDLERFTELYKDDHTRQAESERAKQVYEEAETKLEDLQLQLGKLIGHRYREEQLWSDKIRQTSTWGTWLLMAVNLVLFVVVQLGIEPWKRTKLVTSFETSVANLITPTVTSVASDIASKAAHDAVADAIADAERNMAADQQDAQAAAPTWGNLWQRITQRPVIPLRPIETILALLYIPLVSLFVTTVFTYR